jgi:excisionase family DNA binding protein
MPNLVGLADVLAVPEVATEMMLKKALKATHIDNLLLLSAGRNPLDPGSLVNSPKFTKVLEFLKTQADLIIIDSGPILEVVETKLIVNAVDGVVLVATNGRSSKRAVQRAIDYFRNKQNNNLLGLVFNRVSLPRSYGYSDYYTYGSKFERADGARRQRPFFQKMWPFNRQKLADNGVLNLTEVADYLGVSKNMAYRWCEEGRIQAIKNGRQWSVRLEDLNEFANSYQHTTNGSTRNITLKEA